VPCRGRLCPGEHDREQYRQRRPWLSVLITNDQEVVAVPLSRRGRPRGEGPSESLKIYFIGIDVIAGTKYNCADRRTRDQDPSRRTRRVMDGP
jgi:hypothetical protein